jgi:hypothetical protein
VQTRIQNRKGTSRERSSERRRVASAIDFERFEKDLGSKCLTAQFVLRVGPMSTARDPPVQITDSMMISMRHARTTIPAAEDRISRTIDDFFGNGGLL